MIYTNLAVIFDMDGVLVDSYQAHYVSWNRMLARHDLAMSEQVFASSFGRTGREILEDQFGDHVKQSEISEWDNCKEVDYRDILCEDFPAMAGARELLGNLGEAGFHLAIGSSGPPANVQVVVEQLGCGELFSATVDGHQVTCGKPDPEVFLKAAGKLGIDPRNCAVVEDAPVGITAAKRAGMTPIAITGTAPREELSDGAAIVVDSLAELSPSFIAELIQKHNG